MRGDLETLRVVVVVLMIALALALVAVVILLDRLQAARLALARRPDAISAVPFTTIEGRFICDGPVTARRIVADSIVGDHVDVPRELRPRDRGECYWPDCRCRFPGAVCSGLRE